MTNLGIKLNSSVKRLGTKIEKGTRRLGNKTFSEMGRSNAAFRKVDNTMQSINKSPISFIPGLNMPIKVAAATTHMTHKISNKASKKHSKDLEKYNRRKQLEDKRSEPTANTKRGFL